MMEKNCKQCGKGFVYIPSKKCRRKYCSKECSSASHEKSISSTGKIRAKNISVEKLKNAIHYLTNNDLTIGQIYEVSFLDHIEGATKPLPCVIYGKLIKMNEDSLVIAGWIGSDNLENSTYWTIVKSTITNIKSLF